MTPPGFSSLRWPAERARPRLTDKTPVRRMVEGLVLVLVVLEVLVLELLVGQCWIWC